MSRPVHWTLALLAATAAALPVQAQRVTVIRGVTIVDGTGAPPMSDGVVVIRNGWIEAVGPAGTVAIPAGADVRSLPGRWLLPGFLDLHAHLAFGPTRLGSKGGVPEISVEYDDAASQELARTELAFGVTTVRNPGAPTVEGVRLRDRIRLGLVPGPRIFTAGELLDATPAPGLAVAVKTEAEARAEVDRQAEAGVDYVKLYAGLRPPLVRAAVDQAHRRGLRAIGHLFATSWTEAANAGIDGLVHIMASSPLLLPEARRREFQDGIRGTQFMTDWFRYYDPDSPEAVELLAALRAHHVTIDPTLVVFEAMVRGDDSAVTQSPDLAYAPEVFLDGWRTFTLSQGWTADDYRRARSLWPRVLAFTRRLHEAGVLLTVGTDVPNPWVVPGAGYHRELELLVEAGIGADDVIRMATHDGAQALGVLSELGTVTAGKRADLVVLTGDPLADIRNSRTVEWVIQGGRWHRPADLLPDRLRARGIAAGPR